MAGNAAARRLVAPHRPGAAVVRHPLPSPAVAPAVQRARADDPRLPADKAEALALAVDSKSAIDTAVAGLASSTDPARANVPALVTAESLWVDALTPRHDSTVGDPVVNFFPAHTNYVGSVRLPDTVTYRVSANRRGLWIRARQHDNVDALLPADEIANRIVLATTEASHLRAAKPGTPGTLDRYRARFNALFGAAEFAGLSTTFDPTLDSRGPRTPRARAVFTRILVEDATLAAAYEANTGRIREPIDQYAGPEGLNLLNSPRVQALRRVFFPYPVPVPNTRFATFLAEITAAATALDAADRAAIRSSNDWQRLIERHVPDEDRRSQVRLAIEGIGGAVSIATDPRLAPFLLTWAAKASFEGPHGREELDPTDSPIYRNGVAPLRAAATSTSPNPGLPLFARGRVMRGGSAVAGPTAVEPWLAGRTRTTSFDLAITAPAPFPPGGDAISIDVDVLGPDRTTVLATKSVATTIGAETAYTQAEVEAVWAEDRDFLRDASPSGLIGIMRARGGRAANVAEAITAGRIRVTPFLVRHDSAAVVGVIEPSHRPVDVAYFRAPTYGPPPDAGSFVMHAGLPGFVEPARPDEIHIARTVDVPSRSRRSPDELIQIIVHESVHAFDKPPVDPDSMLELYKTEFRAYWNDGGFGPPDSADCPSPPSGRCFPATLDPTLPPPGPKSPRARAIFDHVYLSPAYRHLHDEYDRGGLFREEVDRYLVPDGINLVVSLRLEELRRTIDGWNGLGFTAFRDRVQAFRGLGPAPRPAAEQLNATDLEQIRTNRAWRDLVDTKVRVPSQRAQIKADLGIPA